MTYVAANSSGVYVTGKTIDSVTQADTHNMFTAKFSLDGKVAWLFETAPPQGQVDYNCGVAVSEGRNNLVYVGRMQGQGLGNENVYVDVRDAGTGVLLQSTLVSAAARCTHIAADETAVYAIVNGDAFKLDPEARNVVAQLPVERVAPHLPRIWVRPGTSFLSVDITPDAVCFGGETDVDLESQNEEFGNGGTDFFIVVFDRDLQNRRWLRQWGDSLDQRWPQVVVASQVNLVYLAGFSGDVIGSIEPRVTAFQVYDWLTGELKQTTRLKPASYPSLVSDGRDAYLALSAESPLRLRSDASVMWTASPPRNAAGIAVANGTVYVTVSQSQGLWPIVGNKLVRYDAATGVMK